MATDPAERRSCEGCRWLTPLRDGPTRQHCDHPAMPIMWTADWAMNHIERQPGCWTAPEFKVTGGMPDALLSPLGRRIKEDWTAPEEERDGE